MLIKRMLLTIMAAIFNSLPFMVNAQTILSGTIRDGEQTPLPYVNVFCSNRQTLLW
jgi:hypothetical protein